MELKSIVYPENNECISSLAASILVRFGIQSEKVSIQEVTNIFKDSYWRHIIVLNIKGLNENLLSEHPAKLDFLKRRLMKSFTKESYISGTASVDSFFTEITKYIQEDAKQAYGHVITQSSSLNTWISSIKTTTKTEDQTVTYASWNELEELIRTNSISPKYLKKINSAIKRLCRSLTDTVVFITSENTYSIKDNNKIPLIWFESKRKDQNQLPYYLERSRWNTGNVGLGIYNCCSYLLNLPVIGLLLMYFYSRGGSYKGLIK